MDNYDVVHMRKSDYSEYLECCQQEIDGKRRVPRKSSNAYQSKNPDVRHKSKRKVSFGRKLLIALLILEICSWLSREGYIVTEKGFVKIESKR